MHPEQAKAEAANVVTRLTDSVSSDRYFEGISLSRILSTLQGRSRSLMAGCTYHAMEDGTRSENALKRPSVENTQPPSKVRLVPRSGRLEGAPKRQVARQRSPIARKRNRIVSTEQTSSESERAAL